MVHLDDDDASPATEPFMVDDIVIQQAADLSAFLSKLAESPFSVSSVTTSVPLRKAGNRHVPKVCVLGSSVRASAVPWFITLSEPPAPAFHTRAGAGVR